MADLPEEAPAPAETEDVEAPRKEVELVAQAPRLSEHPLLRKPCTQLGRTASFAARPAVVHFAGFEVGRTISARLELVNVATDGRRLHVVPPQSQYFQSRCSKRGRVAPGLSETIHIDFTADAWRYYTDALRVYCDDEGLLVPIHAYPVLQRGGLTVPRRLDFGELETGARAIKSLEIKCEVPVAFEYRARLLRPNAQFNLLSPLEGVVPGEGRVELRMEYAPNALGTATTQLELEVSQLDAKPMLIAVAGNAVPHASEAPPAEPPAEPPEPSTAPETRHENSSNKGRVPRRRWRPKEERDEVTVGGVRIPLRKVAPAEPTRPRRRPRLPPTPPASFRDRLVGKLADLEGPRTAKATLSLDETKDAPTASPAEKQRDATYARCGRLVRAVETVVLRRRVAARLAKIKAYIGSRATRAEVAAFVEDDNEASARRAQAAATWTKYTPRGDDVAADRERVVETLLEGMVVPSTEVFPDEFAPCALPYSTEVSERAAQLPMSSMPAPPTFRDVRPEEAEVVDPEWIALGYDRLEDTAIYFPAELPGGVRGIDNESSVRPPRKLHLEPDEPDESIERNEAADEVEATERARRQRDRDVAVRAAAIAANPSASPLPRWLSTARLDYDASSSLAPRRADVAFRRPPERESSVDWPLRVRRIPRPPTLAAVVSRARRASTIAAALTHFPEPSRAFRDRREREPSALACLSEQYHLRGWSVEAAVPLPRAGPDADDLLSESESEDDLAFADFTAPTPEACRDRIGLNVQDDDDNDDNQPRATPSAFTFSVDDANDKANDRLPVVSDIPRDRNRLELYRAHAAARLADAARLDASLARLAQTIKAPHLKRALEPTLNSTALHSGGDCAGPELRAD